MLAVRKEKERQRNNSKGELTATRDLPATGVRPLYITRRMKPDYLSSYSISGYRGAVRCFEDM